MQKEAGFSLITTLALNFSQSPEQPKYEKPTFVGQTENMTVKWEKSAPFEWINAEELANTLNPETLVSILKIILIYFFWSTQMTMQSQCQPWII